MNETYVVESCSVHQDCEVIYSVDSRNGVMIWESHAPYFTHPECQIGDVVTTVTDSRLTGRPETWVPSWTASTSAKSANLISVLEYFPLTLDVRQRPRSTARHS